MRARPLVRALVVLAVLAGAPAARSGEEKPFTDVFRVDRADWADHGINPWFILEPGYVLVLEGEEDGEPVRLTITVLDESRLVNGVDTRVVEEREEKGGKLEEVSRNFFAI